MPIAPITESQAYEQGHDEGNDSSGMLAYGTLWPTRDLLASATPSREVQAFLRGFHDGQECLRDRIERQRLDG